MATVAQVIAVVAPQYVGDARISVASDLAALEMGMTAWGALYTIGQANLVAHMLTVSDRGVASGTSGYGSAGPVTGKTEGQSSVSFGTAAGLQNATLGDASLSTTQYGLEYIRIRQSLAVRTGTWVR